MPYKAALTNRFLRELRKHTALTKQRVSEAINEIMADPRSGTRLRGELEGRLRWRIGEFRIIYMVDDPNRLVVFLDIGPRRSIYE